MLVPQEILNYLQAKSFRPFQIHTASGESFDVRHPEMLHVGRSKMVLFTFVSDDPRIFDRWETISLMLTERISHLDAVAPPSGSEQHA
jgi:hypothetical protein